MLKVSLSLFKSYHLGNCSQKSCNVNCKFSSSCKDKRDHEIEIAVLIDDMKHPLEMRLCEIVYNSFMTIISHYISHYRVEDTGHTHLAVFENRAEMHCLIKYLLDEFPEQKNARYEVQS